MEEDLMKHYITNALKNGKYILELQIEGVGLNGFIEKVLDSTITAFSLPYSQSLSEVWELYVHFKEGFTFKLSSSCTSIGGWDELGSLNISFFDQTNFADRLDRSIYITNDINEFLISELKYLIYEEGNVYSECGIIMVSPHGEQIIVAASISPGSVSMQHSSIKTKFNPELQIDKYTEIEFTAKNKRAQS